MDVSMMSSSKLQMAAENKRRRTNQESILKSIETLRTI